MGDVVFKDDDVFGDGVNIASRLESIAPIGSILVSESVYLNLVNKKGIKTTYVREERLKNVKNPVKIYQVEVEKVETLEIKSTDFLKHSDFPIKKPANWRKPVLIALLGVVIVALAYLFYSYPFKGKQAVELADSQSVDKSIAILPFINLSEEKGNEHFADGLVEDLLNRISVIEELKVISRTSSEMYRKRGEKSIPEIAEELSVSYILEGSVQRYGDKARITVQLIDAINDDHIWAENYDRDIVDIFKTQSEIAMYVASELNTILTSKQKEQIQETRTKNLKAFELYQMGRFYWNKRTEHGYMTSIEYFNKAIDEDPGYGLAYAGLADTYNLMALNGWIEKQEGRDKAVKLAIKALELDENLAEAYTVLGSIYNGIDWDWENAEKAYKRALELRPNYSTAHHYYSEHLSTTGQHEEARKHIDKAVEINPLSFVIRFVSFKLYYNRGHFKEALEDLQKCNELQENHPWLSRNYINTYWQLGQEEEAFEVLKKTLKATPYYNLEIAENIYKASGFKAVKDWKMKIDLEQAENESLYYYYLADFYGMFGEDEKAMEWLEKAYTAHYTTEMSFNIHFRDLHNNPRYIAILKKMNLPLD